jgi:hypothetical protein
MSLRKPPGIFENLKHVVAYVVYTHYEALEWCRESQTLLIQSSSGPAQQVLCLRLDL